MNRSDTPSLNRSPGISTLHPAGKDDTPVLPYALTHLSQSDFANAANSILLENLSEQPNLSIVMALQPKTKFNFLESSAGYLAGLEEADRFLGSMIPESVDRVSLGARRIIHEECIKRRILQQILRAVKIA